MDVIAKIVWESDDVEKIKNKLNKLMKKTQIQKADSLLV